jgi:hypothetical protein
MSEVFKRLNGVNVNNHTEKKNGLTYLSWAWAWAEVKKIYPLATYTIYENKDGWNYHTDNKTGWVKTGVTIEGLEHIEYLPIMDFKNKSIIADNITSFDVNKAIQRSLTKAVARHGLGLYIYAGEDLPQDDINYQEKLKEKLKTKGFSDFFINAYIEQEAPDEPLQKSLLSNDKDFTDSLKAFANAMITSIKMSIENSGRADLVEEMKDCKKLNDFERIYNLL